MKNYIELLSYKLDQELANLNNEQENVISFSKSAFKVYSEIIDELKEFISNYQFIDSEEEIYFFKIIKPRFVAKQMLYGKIFKMESYCKSFSKENRLEYYKNEVKTILKFFRKESKILNYFKTENCMADQYYFQRIEVDIHVFLDVNFTESDKRFSTSFDLIFNKINAFEQILAYLDNQIIAVENKVEENILLLNSDFFWTGDKNELIELMYALIASKKINDGKINKWQFARHLERCFNIKLGDVYKSYSDMFKRKNKMQFMEYLTDSLWNMMEEKDAF